MFPIQQMKSFWLVPDFCCSGFPVITAFRSFQLSVQSGYSPVALVTVKKRNGNAMKKRRWAKFKKMNEPRSPRSETVSNI
jgi:hypothetical protein